MFAIVVLVIFVLGLGILQRLMLWRRDWKKTTLQEEKKIFLCHHITDVELMHLAFEYHSAPDWLVLLFLHSPDFKEVE